MYSYRSEAGEAEKKGLPLRRTSLISKRMNTHMLDKAMAKALKPVYTELQAIRRELARLVASNVTSRSSSPSQRTTKTQVSDSRVIQYGPKLLETLCDKRYTSEGCSTSVLAREIGMTRSGLQRLANRFVEGVGLEGKKMAPLMVTSKGSVGGFIGRSYKITKFNQAQALAYAKELRKQGVSAQ